MPEAGSGICDAGSQEGPCIQSDACNGAGQERLVTVAAARDALSACRRDDLWIISNNPEFSSGFAAGQLGDRSRAPWVAVVRSLWHGPNQDGK